MAYPQSDRTYAFIADASMGTDSVKGGMGVILTQMDKDSKKSCNQICIKTANKT
jgi:hypothetical protein